MMIIGGLEGGTVVDWQICTITEVVQCGNDSVSEFISLLKLFSYGYI